MLRSSLGFATMQTIPSFVFVVVLLQLSAVASSTTKNVDDPQRNLLQELKKTDTCETVGIDLNSK